MRIGVAGKGGSGKTTVAGILARSYAAMGLPVLAIDADSNPNLGLILGLSPARTKDLKPLVKEPVFQEVKDSSGNASRQLSAAPLEIAKNYGVETPGGVVLLVAGVVSHAGSG